MPSSVNQRPTDLRFETAKKFPFVKGGGGAVTAVTQ
jgi:hypothetical protein